MYTTTYKCDKCGAEDTTNLIELHRVGLFVDQMDMGSYSHPGRTNDWCKKCLIDSDLLLRADGNKKPNRVSPVVLDGWIKKLRAYNSFLSKRT